MPYGGGFLPQSGLASIDVRTPLRVSTNFGAPEQDRFRAICAEGAGLGLYGNRPQRMEMRESDCQRLAGRFIVVDIWRGLFRRLILRRLRLGLLHGSLQLVARFASLIGLGPRRR